MARADVAPKVRNAATATNTVIVINIFLNGSPLPASRALGILQRSPFGAPFLGIEQYAEKLVELSDMI